MVKFWGYTLEVVRRPLEPGPEKHIGSKSEIQAAGGHPIIVGSIKQLRSSGCNGTKRPIFSKIGWASKALFQHISNESYN